VFEGMLGAIPSTVFLLYITYLKLYVSWVINQRDRIMAAVTEATRKGQSALNRSADGTST
jgi:hypothetical protein